MQPTMNLTTKNIKNIHYLVDGQMHVLQPASGLKILCET